MSILSKEMMSLKLERYELPFSRLPKAFEGFKILQLSDPHLRRKASQREAAVAALIATAQPDVVVITGDLANHASHWPHAEAWLKSLPLPKLSFAVPGNWEYECGVDTAAFAQCMVKLGVTPLCNHSTSIERGGEALYLLGVDDIREGQPDLAAAFSEVPSSAFRVALCHNPDVLESMPPSRFDLLLCGHTHGGQICLPGWGAIFTSTRLGKSYESGLYEPEDQRYVYVSRGIGTVRLHWRLFCPPEVTLFTLRRDRGKEERA